MKKARYVLLFVILVAAALHLHVFTIPASANEIWVTPAAMSIDEATGNWATTSVGNTHFGFSVPDNLETFSAAKIVLIGNKSESITYDLHLSVSSDGHPHDNFTNSMTSITFSLIQDALQEIDVTQIIPPGLLVAGSDYVSLVFTTSKPLKYGRVVGLRFLYTGPMGEPGAVGPQGAIGPQGVQGEVGPMGAQGPMGLTGPEGPQGEVGPMGPQGIQGEKGDTGPQGAAGLVWKGQWDPSATYSKDDAVQHEGSSYLSLTSDNAGMTPEAGSPAWTLLASIGTQGPQGDQGPAGPPGPQGETGAAGSQGQVGPMGPVGPQGPQGSQGIQGLEGIPGANGADGAPGASPFGLNGNNAYYKVGNVGIGTSEPSYPLEVVGEAKFGGDVHLGGKISDGGSFWLGYLDTYNVPVYCYNPYYSWICGWNNYVNPMLYASGNWHLRAQKSVRVETGSPGSGEGTLAAIFTESGVGIGTSSPIRRLHSFSNTESNEFVMEVGDGMTDWKKWNFYANGGTGNKQNLHLRILNDGGTGDTLHSMSWLSNGNVGIGTQFPSQKLTVAGTIQSTAGGFKFPDGTTAASATNFVRTCSGSGCGTVEMVPGDGNWGTWGDYQMCPERHYVCGIRVRIEGSQGSGGDDTGMNGLRFRCCPFN